MGYERLCKTTSAFRCQHQALQTREPISTSRLGLPTGEPKIHSYWPSSYIRHWRCGEELLCQCDCSFDDGRVLWWWDYWGPISECLLSIHGFLWCQWQKYQYTRVQLQDLETANRVVTSQHPQKKKQTINKMYSYVTNLWESFLSTWFQQPRLRGFPQGLGKGHDAAVVGSWLDQELQQIDVASVVTCIRKGFFDHLCSKFA